MIFSLKIPRVFRGLNASSKSKVTPNKCIPRMELKAYVIGTRLAALLKDTQRLKFDKYHFWTDS